MARLSLSFEVYHFEMEELSFLDFVMGFQKRGFILT